MDMPTDPHPFEPLTEAAFRALRAPRPARRPVGCRVRSRAPARRWGPGDWDLNPELKADFAVMAPPRPAAVLVPIVLRAELTVLLTQRSHDVPSHPGQISFPGGKVEPGDATPVDCALREAHEEIGLEAARVEPLGYLDSYRTGTGFQINPVVAFVTPGFEPVLDPREVLEVFEVPLAFLMDPANHQKALARVARPRALLLCHALRGALYLGRDRRHAQEHAPEAVSAMIRVVVENILLFLLPTAIYLGYVLLTRRTATIGRRRHQRGAAGVAVRAGRAVRGRHARLLRDDHAGRHAGPDLHAPAHEERQDRARPAEVAADR